MPFDPTVYVEPSINPISDDEWDFDFPLSDLEMTPDEERLFDFQINLETEIMERVGGNFVNVLNLMDELSVVCTQRLMGISTLQPRVRG